VGLAAFDALQHCPYESRPTFRARHPRPILPRRIVTHVLGVSTLEIRHPVAVIVEMKRDDLSRARRPVGELRLQSQRVARMSEWSGLRRRRSKRASARRESISWFTQRAAASESDRHPGYIRFSRSVTACTAPDATRAEEHEATSHLRATHLSGGE
jgi:hypothetical protein